MKIKKYDNFNQKLNEEIKEDEEFDEIGGISGIEYDRLINKLTTIYNKFTSHTATDKEKIVLEIINTILTTDNENYNFETYFHRRLGYIKNKK